MPPSNGRAHPDGRLCARIVFYENRSSRGAAWKETRARARPNDSDVTRPNRNFAENSEWYVTLRLGPFFFFKWTWAFLCGRIMDRGTSRPPQLRSETRKWGEKKKTILRTSIIIVVNRFKRAAILTGRRSETTDFRWYTVPSDLS